MNNPKGNSIILTYGFLIFQLFSGGTHSLFVYLIALLVEFLLLVLLYAISPGRGKVNLLNVLIGIIPFVLFNYAIIYFASAKVDHFPGGIAEAAYGFLQPLFDHRYQLMLVAAGILIGYLAEFWKTRSLKKIESKVLFQALKIWILGLVTTTVLLSLPADSYPYGIALIPISRILMELVVYTKTTKNKVIRRKTK